MKVSIKTKFMIMIITMLILAVCFTYAITITTVYKSISERFYRENQQKRKQILYYLDDLSLLVQRESKIISENIFLKNYMKGEYFKDKEYRPKYSENNFLNFLWEEYDYNKLINELRENVKTNFRLESEVQIDIINKYGIKIKEDTETMNYGREFSYNFSEKLLQEKIEYIENRKNIYIRGYSPIFSENANNFLGGIYVTIKLDKRFLEYFKTSFNADFIIYDSSDGYIISTFEKPAEIDEIINKVKLDKIKLNFVELEIYKKIYQLTKLQLSSEDGKKVGTILVAFDKMEILDNIKRMALYLFLFLFIFFSLIAIISTAVLDTIVYSIKNLTMKINSIREGNFNVSLGSLVKRNDEIGILAKDFEDMVEILKNKINQLEDASKNNIEYSERLKLVNDQLESTQKQMIDKNSSIDTINKNLNRRITEISNLYYLIINTAKYIVEDSFYQVSIKGIREGLGIRKVIFYEVNENELIIKAKLGTGIDKQSIAITDNIINILKENEIYRVKDKGEFAWDEELKVPYIMPLLSMKNSTTYEVYGMLVFDNEKELYIDAINSIITYVRTIILAYENRRLYLKLVNENKKMEETMKKLKESERMKNIFLANVSHELKVPLVPIKGYTEILLNGTLGDLDISQRKVLITMLNNSERLQTIIENILNYSRIESGKYQFINVSFKLITSINGALEQLENTISKNRIRVHKDFEEYSSEAYGDGDAIKQVLINIISNSIKFSDEDSNIYIEIKDKGEKYTISIQDEGIGMEKEKIEQIFESFKQLEEGDTRKYGGVGLGLTVAQKILEYYGEKLIIKSKINEGTTISFYVNKLIR